MLKLILRRTKRAALPPGTLVHVGEKRTHKPTITAINYDDRDCAQVELDSPEECAGFLKKPGVTWFNVDGVHDVDIIDRLGKVFGLHPLQREDVVNTQQRPKLDDEDAYLFLVLKMITYDEEQNGIKSEQVSLVLGANYVLTFQENPGDVFNPIRERIKNSRGRIRKMGADYLAYALVDAVVDNYFSVLEHLGMDLEELEDEITENPTARLLEKVHDIRRELIYLRRQVWPLREALQLLVREETDLVRAETDIYFRDIYDHTVQIVEVVETYRDLVAGMMDIYLSSVSNRMNEVMKVLTLIATIFIPLTFIAGVYGMNFAYMPELEWEWGYPAALGLMAGLGLGLAWYFKRKNWL